MGARNRIGIGLSYRSARALIWNPFKDSRNRLPAWRAGTTRQIYLYVNLVVMGTPKLFKTWAPKHYGIGIP
jgi:hypothetical protein